MADLNVVDFVFADPLLHSSGLDVSREEIVTQLTSVGFTQEMLGMVITALSGGWKMKLALARAMLMKVRCSAAAGQPVCFRVVLVPQSSGAVSAWPSSSAAAQYHAGAARLTIT